ncbi:ABC transporter, ATP-binding subunit, PltJ-like [Sulfurospirillum diekertiae]|uniref:ABC transporter, ATP-binding subunit, PltJ-like n=1 Tax=Sulfurospirillum diekertiae TaxID=1854492 RepID=A0A290HEQ5_9BACT|nr:ABC transporter permease [Sulfurospirillum diekertiae]ATB69927.1 ABC transporter, ATP-binding subunit, PltJ-like [Sulfurospirillum diekertiae]
MIGRLLALIRKEALAIKNDKKSLFVVIVPPLIQVMMFSFAATLEVKHIDLAVFDQDGSHTSQELIQNLKGSSYVQKLLRVHHQGEIEGLINTQKVLAVLVIPSGFGKEVLSAKANVQLLLDGRRSNTAQIVEGYLSSIVQTFFLSKQPSTSAISIQTRFFFNPNLSNFWWIVPNLFGTITMVVAMLLTALSIARERELGTFDQILVSPLRPFEILIGKLVPALLISMSESFLILLAALYLFGVPFMGSLTILYTGVIVFLFSISGIGLFISALSNTQQQAILGSFVFLLPSILLSGFATPVENMPSWLQPLTTLTPLKYYLVLIKGVFLKDISWEIAWSQIVPMLFLGIISMSIAMIFFRRRSR